MHPCLAFCALPFLAGRCFFCFGSQRLHARLVSVHHKEETRPPVPVLSYKARRAPWLLVLFILRSTLYERLLAAILRLLMTPCRQAIHTNRRSKQGRTKQGYSLGHWFRKPARPHATSARPTGSIAAPAAAVQLPTALGSSPSGLPQADPHKVLVKQARELARGLAPHLGAAAGRERGRRRWGQAQPAARW